jgi:hypothetical protein
MAELPISALAQIPPIWLMSREALPGNPYDDTPHFLQRIRGLQNLDCFGVTFLITSYPPGYGLTVDGAGNHFDRTMIKVMEEHSDSAALLHDGPIHESVEASGYFTWTTWPLYAVHVQLSPGVTADLHWLVVFT